MSYQERRAIVSLISTILISTVYTGVMLQRYPEGGEYSPEVFRYWGAFFLILIPVSVIAQLIIRVVFIIIHAIVTNEGEPSIIDERDKLIELKAARNALYMFTFGLFVAMGSLVIEQPPALMFGLLFLSGVLAGMVSDISEFYSYRRGV